jgi:hypothetical protein
MDWNLNRRKREIDIAAEVADELFRKIPINDKAAAPNELVAHHFGLVCERLKYTPDEASVGRILRYAVKEVARKQQKIVRTLIAVDDAVRAL